MTGKESRMRWREREARGFGMKAWGWIVAEELGVSYIWLSERVGQEEVTFCSSLVYGL